MLNITIINGPNLNLLGKREPGIYGNESFEDFLVQLKQAFPQVNFTYFQSNVEGELVNAIQQYGFNQDGMIINPAAYTHTSVAIGDAIASIQTPVIEVQQYTCSRRFQKNITCLCKSSWFHCWLRLKGILSCYNMVCRSSCK